MRGSISLDETNQFLLLLLMLSKEREGIGGGGTEMDAEKEMNRTYSFPMINYPLCGKYVCVKLILGKRKRSK